jgi:hypothetical protein
VGKITASTEAISAGAADLAGVGPELYDAAGVMSGATGAAFGTSAAAAYDLLCSQFTTSVTELGGAADQMAVAAEAAADCYIKSDRLTN